MINKLKNEFKNKKILVTGGTGSIGSIIVEKLLQFNPKQIRVYSRDDTKQFELEKKLNDNQKLRLLIGDIRDKERLNLAMEDIDIVFHAAALKHVVSCEKNPFEAVKTNVLGTQNVIDCAFNNNVEKVIGISTDKAASPSNVLGCTKLLSEKIMLASYFYKGNKKTKFCFVRFGNVLGARGSVIPLFLSQIKRGIPITLTDPEMSRFFMSLEDAVNLIFKSSIIMKDREIFILKMPIIKIGDLAEALIEIINKKTGKNQNIKINIIGKNNGEKMHELILSKDESCNALETDDMFIILPHMEFSPVKIDSSKYPKAEKTIIKEYSSYNQKKNEKK
jgi:FlaA1/EpsC-like NDP-sugar epimerase